MLILGGAIGVIEGAVRIFIPNWLGIAGGILAIITSLIVLSGQVDTKIPLLKELYELSDLKWLVELILGVLMIIFGAAIGGIIVVVASVLRLILL